MKKNRNGLIINPLVVLVMSTAFIIGSIVLSFPIYMGFILGIVFTTTVLYKSGFEMKLLMKTIFLAIKQVKHLSMIILMIGATTSIWLSSGVVQTIMYYGFEKIKGINFLVAAFLIMVVVSVFMGTSVGTISTVGISLLGIGKGLNIPEEIIVGVLVSGGFIADKISPLSGLVNLTMTTVNITYKQYVKDALISLIPTIIITAVVYYFIGNNYNSSDYSQLEIYKSEISKVFNTSPMLLILPLTVILLSVLGLDSVLTILSGIVLGSVLSIIFQNMNLVDVLNSMIFGYHGNTASAQLNQMLNSGGILSMIEVILVVVSGVVLVKLFEIGNILLPLMNKLMNSIKTKMGLILSTMFVSSLLTIITSDQTAGIILPGSVMQEKFREFNVDNTVLARIISDSGVIIAPLMAWNVNAFIITPILGVSANDYALFAVLCYICPIVSAVISYFMYNDKYGMSK